MSKQRCEKHCFLIPDHLHDLWDSLTKISTYVVVYRCVTCGREKSETLADVTHMTFAQKEILAKEAERNGFIDARIPF